MMSWSPKPAPKPASGTTADASAFLPFTPTEGKVYTLSATLAKPSGASGQWAAIGFTNGTLGTASGNNSESFYGGTNAPAPWVLYRANNSEIAAWAGPGTSVAADNNSGYSGDQTLKVVLDTTSAFWKAEWFVGASSIHNFTYTTNPTISYVGLGRENGAGADFSMDSPRRTCLPWRTCTVAEVSPFAVGNLIRRLPPFSGFSRMGIRAPRRRDCKIADRWAKRDAPHLILTNEPTNHPCRRDCEIPSCKSCDLIVLFARCGSSD